MDLETLIDGYLLFCQSGGRSKQTVRWYSGKLRIFRDYSVEHDGIDDVAAITATSIRGFIVHLQTSVRADEHNPYKPDRDDRLSPQTVQGYVRVLKAFFSWAAREGLVDQSPMTHVSMPKAPKVIVPTFSQSQVEALLSTIDRGRTVGYRDYCIMLTFLDTGMRLSELTELSLASLDLGLGQCKVLGKGSKERLVPLGGSLQRALWKYINQYRSAPAFPGLDTLFLTRDGRQMARSTVYQMVRRYGNLAELTGVRCSPHTFRHTFAKNFLMNGGDLFTLQRILGHSSLDVVRLYVNLASEDITAQHRKYSPVDMMKIKV